MLLTGGENFFYVKIRLGEAFAFTGTKDARGDTSEYLTGKEVGAMTRIIKLVLVLTDFVRAITDLIRTLKS